MDSGTRRRSWAALSVRGPLPRLHLVTNRELLLQADFPSRAASALAAGGERCALHLRGRGVPGRWLWDLVSVLRAGGTGGTLWVNDRVDLALAIRAEGVQLGGGSLPVGVARRLLGRSAWVGQSVHSVDEAAASEADVAVLGNIYPTESHPGRPPLGVQAVQRAASLPRPILAIGGITPDGAAEVVDAGAWGVAVLSGVWRERDPAGAVRSYLRALEPRSPSVRGTGAAAG